MALSVLFRASSVGISSKKKNMLKILLSFEILLFILEKKECKWSQAIDP